MNVISFSCPDEDALFSWVAALRLAVWEKARLEEIYTGHLLRMSLSDHATGKWKEPFSTLVRGRLEGWVKVRVAGQTEWKRVWAVISARGPSSVGENDGRPVSPTNTLQKQRNRMSSLFSSSARASSPPPSPVSGPAMIALFPGTKPRDRKNPFLTVTDVTQAFSVYPDRVELINLSTLIKVEGRLGEQDYADSMKGREGWMFMMPEVEGDKLPPIEMLKWVIGEPRRICGMIYSKLTLDSKTVGLHDAFELHGRPTAYTWDPYDHKSQMFAYPVGEHKDVCLSFECKSLAALLNHPSGSFFTTR